MNRYADAIGSVESGNRYDLTGPQTKSGDRAYGRYQVMGANIPTWTQAFFGRQLSPQEFLQNPDAQDAVFNGQFGSYVSKYGNPQDAASAWFSGRPLAQAGSASDGYNTVPQYVAKFNKALGAGDTTPMADVSDAPMLQAMRGGYDPNAPLLDRLRTGGPGALIGAPNGIFPDAQGNPGYNFGRALALAGASLRDNPQALMAATIAQKNKKLVQIGTDEFGNPRYGTFDETSGTVSPLRGLGVGGAGDASGADGSAPITAALKAGATGEALLKNAPPGVAAQVRGMANGDIPFSAASLQRTPQGRMLGSLLSQYEPGTSMQEFEGRAAGIKDWAVKSNEAQRRMNQMASHLGGMPDAYEAMGNSNSPLLNGAENWFNTQVYNSGSGGPVDAYKTRTLALAHEATAFLKNANASDADIKAWDQKFSDAASPGQFRDVLREFRSVMGDSVREMAAKRQRAVGPGMDARMGPIMTPTAQAAFDKIDAYLGANGGGASLPKGVTSIKVIQ